MNTKIRKLNKNDINYFKEYYEDDEIKKQFKFTQNEFNKKNIINKMINNVSEFERHYAIVKNDKYAGTVSLKKINFVNKNAELAIVVRKKYWGTGVSKHAIQLILEYGFEKLGLNKIYLNVFSNNSRAIAFYLKSGFNFEGSFKEHVYINNEYNDLNWYSINFEEWRKIK